MKSKITVLATVLLACFVFSAFAEEAGLVKLAKPVGITTEDGKIIDVERYGFASVNYRDMDGDNVPDLLVGEFEDGALHIYKNYGTEKAPIFRDRKLAKDVNGDPMVTGPA